MTEVETAEQTVAGLEDKRRALITQQLEIDAERKQIAFAAHSGSDPKARARLDKINAQHASFASEMDSLTEAITEANNRLATAQRDAALAADRANAEALRVKLSRFEEIGNQLDDALWDIATSVNEMVALLNEMHALGQVSPTSEQFRVNGTACIKAMLQELPQLWVRDFEFSRLAPSQKKTFKAVVASWSGMIENNIAGRLGETKEEKAA